MGGLTLTGDYAAAAIPARVAMELGDWEQASRVPVREEAVPWAQAISWAAIGVGSARSGNLPRAAEAEAKLAGLRDATAKQNNVYWSNQVEVQRREVAAWSAASSGKMDDAVKLARSAAELEESMDKAAVTPGAVLPAREMLAEILAKGNHPAEALVDYERVLKIAPNRFNALYGAARSAEQAGNETSAKEYFQKLLEVAAGEERPELRTAREKVIALKASAKP
jgi:tetratricopeptide (TPR) repeat protein